MARMSVRRPHALHAVVALVLALAPALPAARGDDAPSAGEAKAADPPADPVAEEKKRKAELRRRRDELPPSARRAMAIVDRFIEKDFRVWGTLREEVVALGADAMPALLVALEEI